MLYVDIEDVCKAFKKFATKILKDEFKKSGNGLEHIVNVYYPKPVTILELAEIVQKVIVNRTNGKLQPKIEIIDMGRPPSFTESGAKNINVEISKAKKLLGISELKSPEQSIDEIVRNRLQKHKLN